MASLDEISVLEQLFFYECNFLVLKRFNAYT